MTNKKYGINTIGYTGVEARTPPNFSYQKRAPRTSDFRNYTVGDIWFDSSLFNNVQPINFPRIAAPAIYILGSKISKKGQWIQLGNAGDLETLTGDAGGVVPQDGNDNINVLGTANHIVTTGNPGINTVTWDIGDSIADNYTTDSGVAVAAGNNLNVLGDNFISTSGSGNTITVELKKSNTTAFFATLSAYLPNVVGEAQFFQVPYDTTVYDLGSDFDTTTGEFEAPVDGIYFFISRVAVNPIPILDNTDNVSVIISKVAGPAYLLVSDNINGSVIRNTPGGNTFDMQCCGFLTLSAGELIRTEIFVDSQNVGAMDNVGINPGSANVYRTYFQGHLVTPL